MLNFLRKNKTFFIEPFIYVNENGRAVRGKLTNTVMWLEKFTVIAKTEKEADREAFKHLHEKYPQYRGAIWIL